MDTACRDRILSNDYYDFIVDYRVAEPEEGVTDYCIGTLPYLGFVAYVNRTQLPPLSIATYSYATIPKLYTILAITETTDVEALQNSGILQVQEGLLELTGRGVLLGFVDTGIDYRSDSFRYSDGSSKIEAIWDQTIETGRAPEGENYGTLYTRAEINQALQDGNTESVPSRDFDGHGTALAEIAAAAAPGASIAMVKLKEAKQYLKDFYAVSSNENIFQETDIMIGISYLHRLATERNMPLVICLGVGTNSGDHTGKSSLALLTNILAIEESRAVVIAGGNEGNARHHYKGSDEYSEVEIRVGEGERGFFVEFWGESPDIYAISLRSPSGEVVPKIPARLGTSDTFRFLYEGTVVTVDYRLVEREAGEELIALRFLDPAPGIWSVGVYSTNLYAGEYHLWLPITGMISPETYFLNSNPYVTLTEPSNAGGTITVSGYNDENNSLYPESSRGYTRDGGRKPDIAAPAVNLSTSRGLYSGTGMAAAITAGAAADFMEWAIIRGNLPIITTTDMKRYFIRGATRDSGVVYPNRETGLGHFV